MLCALDVLHFVLSVAIFVVENVTRLLDDPSAYAAMTNAINPYGDGRAGEYIADILRSSARFSA